MMLPMQRFRGGSEPLLTGALTMIRYGVGAGVADIWEERLVTGVCQDAQFFTAIDVDDAHYVHDAEVIVDACKVGPRGGIPATVR